MAQTPRERPVLWHLAMSHYNEKARWALDFKRVRHSRRAVMPPAHALVALFLGAGGSFPVMVVGREVYPDSTAIIAALEEIAPEPPLYPADPADRARALELEDRFDRVIGPMVRRLGYQSILCHPEIAQEMLALGGPPSRRRALASIFPLLRPAMRSRFRVPAPGDDQPRLVLEDELAFIAAELAGRDFLVGDRFSVADLTAAALLAPLVCPEAMPVGLPVFPSELLELSGELSASAAGHWARQIYLKHR